MAVRWMEHVTHTNESCAFVKSNQRLLALCKNLSIRMSKQENKRTQANNLFVLLYHLSHPFL